MDRAKVHAAIDVVLDALEGQRANPVDELVPVTADALAPFGLEYRPVLALAQSGELRTVWIGRRRYTRRSWLAALADALPPAVADEPTDELAAAARRRAARRVA